MQILLLCKSPMKMRFCCLNQELEASHRDTLMLTSLWLQFGASIDMQTVLCMEHAGGDVGAYGFSLFCRNGLMDLYCA